jgi:hypothetical protein
MQLTIISHLWNEEFLLSYWLRHNYPLFDDGIFHRPLFGDNSATPGWGVRQSRNEWFDAREVDAEVMAVEREAPVGSS